MDKLFRLTPVLCVVFWVGCLASLQGCQGLENPLGTSASEFSVESVDPVTAVTSSQTESPTSLNAYPGVPYAAYSTCYAASPTDPTTLSTCLNDNAVLGATFTSQAIANCISAGHTSSLFLAYCLSSAGEVVQDYRAPKQYDIDMCAAAVAAEDVADCLAKHGVRSGVTQADIDQCVVTVGESSVEKCLWGDGIIPKQPILMQSDADLCNLVESGTSTLALCLQNSGLLAATVTEATVDGCVTAATEALVVRCLRVHYWVPRVLMQYHINVCNTNVGSTNIAACLGNEGVLPVDSTVAANVTAFQTSINTCVTNAGVTHVAQCLRTAGLISTQVMQAHIGSCFAVAGMNAYNCLTANFATLPATLTSTALQGCFATNGNTAAGAATCLASQNILNTAPAQTNISECAYMVGQDPDATGTLPGQVGIAACLNGSGMLPTGLTLATLQSDIDACVTKAAGSTASVSACLNTNSYVASFAAMTATTGVFGANCLSCHKTGNANGTVNFSVYSTVVAQAVPGDSATSTLWTEVNTAKMPPAAVNTPADKLSAANIALIALWINQGANDN